VKITQRLLERKYFYIAVFWTLLITYLSLITLEKKDAFMLTIPNKDKIVHFGFYFVFVFCWTNAIKPKLTKSKIKIVFVAVLYGIIIEVFQSMFTETREADFFDAFANTYGAVTAYFFLEFTKNKS
jgi:VanZ family protein